MPWFWAGAATAHCAGIRPQTIGPVFGPEAIADHLPIRRLVPQPGEVFLDAVNDRVGRRWLDSACSGTRPMRQ